MHERTERVLKRTNNLKDFYTNAIKLIDSLKIPDKFKKLLKEKLLNDVSLRNLIEGNDLHKTPRIFLMGRTGVGKSSFINALCEGYVAPVDDTQSCTKELATYPCRDKDGNLLLEIMDSRGIAESVQLDTSVTAEESLLKSIKEFSPDVAIYMLNCTHRDAITDDIDFMKKVTNLYSESNGLDVPIIVVVNKCDEMAPARQKEPEQYSESKVNKINEVIESRKALFSDAGLDIEAAVGISSLIDWADEDGNEISVDEIANMTESEVKNLTIAFDGRYHIDELRETMIQSVKDYEVQRGFELAFKLEGASRAIANRIVVAFTAASAVVGATPIPISDIGILLSMQAAMVALVASLSGRDINLQTGTEYIGSICGATGVGITLRTLAQQASKALNIFVPAVGSGVSGAIAAAGTLAIGKSAIAYFISDKDIDEAKRIFKEEFNTRRC